MTPERPTLTIAEKLSLSEIAGLPEICQAELSRIWDLVLRYRDQLEWLKTYSPKEINGNLETFTSLAKRLNEAWGEIPDCRRATRRIEKVTSTTGRENLLPIVKQRVLSLWLRGKGDTVEKREGGEYAPKYNASEDSWRKVGAGVTLSEAAAWAVVEDQKGMDKNLYLPWFEMMTYRPSAISRGVNRVTVDFVAKGPEPQEYTLKFLFNQDGDYNLQSNLPFQHRGRQKNA